MWYKQIKQQSNELVDASVVLSALDRLYNCRARCRLAAMKRKTGKPAQPASPEAYEQIATQRYIELIEALGREMGEQRGWKAEAASKLGIAPAHLSRIIAGDKKVGQDLVGRACQRLRIDPVYFFGGMSLEEARKALADVPQIPWTLVGVQEASRAFLERTVRGEVPSENAAWALAVAVHNLPFAQKARAVLEAQGKREAWVGLAFDLAASVVASTRELADHQARPPEIPSDPSAAGVPRVRVSEARKSRR